MTDKTNKMFALATQLPGARAISRSRCIMVLALVMLGIAAVPAASAGPLGDRVILTVNSDAIEVPGGVLPHGKYVLEFLALQRRVVEISTMDGRPVGLFSVVPNLPAARIDDVQFNFSRPSLRGPERLTGFVNPIVGVDYEFVYRQAKAKPSGRFQAKTSRF
jgi:hypothetical protein